jgi:hypothetical protein
MTFDPTITFGAVLNAAVLLIGFVGAFYRIGGRIDLLAQRMESVERSLENHADTDRRLTTLEERITNHVQMLTLAQRDISDLRRGQGFITAHRKSVDGEYP